MSNRVKAETLLLGKTGPPATKTCVEFSLRAQSAPARKGIVFCLTLKVSPVLLDITSTVFLGSPSRPPKTAMVPSSRSTEAPNHLGRFRLNGAWAQVPVEME